MSGPANDLLLQTLIHPARMAEWQERDWDLLIRQARAANLLGRIDVMARELGLMERLPVRVKAHLQAENQYYLAQQSAMSWEASNIERILHSLQIPVILLKGAAYLKQGNLASRGRIFHDIDILVPHESLPEAEQRLNRKGWMSTHLDSYDQRYYRQWMHELPPMQHYSRKTVLDMHHNILPSTARNKPDSRSLIEASVALEGHTRLRVLSGLDMIIHSATHLFHEGEQHNALRDLVDLDLLVREYVRDSAWQALADRAVMLDLVWPVYYALRYLQKFLQRDYPGEILRQLERQVPAGLRQRWMDFLYAQTMRPDHPSCRGFWTPVAMNALYIRGHYLRMPLRLLLPHLVRKSLRKTEEQKTLL